MAHVVNVYDAMGGLLFGRNWTKGSAQEQTSASAHGSWADRLGSPSNSTNDGMNELPDSSVYAMSLVGVRNEEEDYDDDSEDVSATDEIESQSLFRSVRQTYVF